MACGLEQSIRIFPSWSNGMKPNVGSIRGFTDGDLQAVNFVDPFPVMDRRAAQRVHAQRQAGSADGVHVNHVAQVVDVGQNEIFLMGARCLDGRGERHPPHPATTRAQQFVGPILNPLRHVGLGRAPVGRVVFEATVLRRIVRGGDHDAVRQPPLPAPVVNEDGARDGGCGCHTLVRLNERLDHVAR